MSLILGMEIPYVYWMQLTERQSMHYHFFFLAVKTNVGFNVVGEFVVQHETKDSIRKGLTAIKLWVDNAAEKPKDWKWKPRFFMTDFCEREIAAIEEIFPGIFFKNM